MQAGAAISACRRAQLNPARPAGPRRHRVGVNLSASRRGCGRWRSLSSSDDAESGAGGGGSSGGGGSGGSGGQTEEVQELLRLRAQAARLNELFFAPAAPEVSDLEGELVVVLWAAALSITVLHRTVGSQPGASFLTCTGCYRLLQ